MQLFGHKLSCCLLTPEQCGLYLHPKLVPLGTVCRHALAYPLVDTDVGQRPQQHHTSMTAAAAAKQRPRQLQPLPQPIPTALDTRVKDVQSIEAVLLGMRGRLQVRAD